MKKFVCIVISLLVMVSLCFMPACSDDEGVKIDFENATYFAFGDSITYGADSSRGYAQMDNPYPKLVSESLGLKGYVNYAVSSSTTAINVPTQTSGYFPSINTQVHGATGDAQIISIMCGTNDYTQSVQIGSITDTQTTTFYGSLNDICSYIKENYPNAFVFFMTPYKMFAYHEVSGLYTKQNKAGFILEDYVNAIKNVCKKYNLSYLDMFKDGKFEDEYYENYSDGLHPSQNFVTNHTAPQIVKYLKSVVL